MNILYQDNILEYLDSFTLNNFPHTILLRGPEGSGKHLICSYIANKFNLELIDITDNLTLEFIDTVYISTVPRFYIINSDKLSLKEQNVILKFLEEPSDLIYILLINSNSFLLDTVINRCLKIELNRYSKNQLATFLNTNNELILKISQTPGDVLTLQNLPFEDMYNFCCKIFKFIHKANLSNCLTISNNLNFTKKETDESKYDIDLFCKILLYTSKELSYEVYILTDELCNNLKIPNINKQNLFENYLMKLKYTIHD